MGDLERVQKFIADNNWIFAKTMAYIPHWYCLRQQYGNKKEYAWVVNYIRTNSREGKYGNMTYKYFYLNGYKYWDMDDTVESCDLINRDIYPKKFKKKEERNLFSEQDDISDILKLIGDGELGKVLEIECGSNLLYSHIKERCSYTGIETSENLLQEFKQANKQAETIYDKMSNIYIGEQDLIICIEADLLDKDDIRRIESNLKQGGRVIISSTKPFPMYAGYTIIKNKNHFVLIREKQ